MTRKLALLVMLMTLIPGGSVASVGVPDRAGTTGAAVLGDGVTVSLTAYKAGTVSAGILTLSTSDSTGARTTVVTLDCAIWRWDLALGGSGIGTDGRRWYVFVWDQGANDLVQVSTTASTGPCGSANFAPIAQGEFLTFVHNGFSVAPVGGAAVVATLLSPTTLIAVGFEKGVTTPATGSTTVGVAVVAYPELVGIRVLVVTLWCMDPFETGPGSEVLLAGSTQDENFVAIWIRDSDVPGVTDTAGLSINQWDGGCGFVSDSAPVIGDFVLA